MANKSVNRSINLFINGKQVENSLNSVRTSMNNLAREVNKLERGSDEYIRKSAELRKVRGYYNEIRQEINGMPSLFDRLTKSAGGFVTLMVGSFAVSNVVGKFKQLVDLSAELADKQADVRKTTGMTAEEVRKLTQELDKLNTRTSRTDLLSIAEEGGRIGIASEEIADFVEAMNKANVALGDTFGSASEVANVLGKLRFLYKETSEMGVSDAYNKIGSALNELGANGVASEQNIAAFATRVGALPNAFKPSIADAMALGAAFEESGVNAEVAGRSYSTLIQTAANDTKGFAEVMGVTEKQVIELINTNPTEFFLQFADSLKGLDANGVRMAQTLKKLGIGADGVNKIIGAAATNNDRFRESIALSNKAMEEGTSLIDEYNVKNENLAATLEKIQKRFVEWIDSDTVQDTVGALVEWFAKFIGAIDDSDSGATKFRNTLVFLAKVIGILVAAQFSMVAATKLNALWMGRATLATKLFEAAQKSALVTNNLVQIAVHGLSAVFYLFTGRITAARQSVIFFNAALRANPLGLFLTALTAVVGYFVLFRRESEKAARAQTAINEAMADAEKSYAEQSSKLELLLAVAKDVNVEQNKRIEALNQLKELMPQYADLLTLEKINTDEASKAIKKYTDSLYENARVKALMNKFNAIEEEKLDLENQSVYDSSGFWQKRRTEGLSIKYGIDLRDVSSPEDIRKLLRDKHPDKTEEEIGELTFQLSIQIGSGTKAKKYSDLEDAQAAIVEELKKTGTGTVKPQSGYETDPDGLTDDEEINKKLNDELERRRKIAAELTKIERDRIRQQRDLELANREERAKLMEDGFAKEAELLDIERQKKINRLNDEQEDLLALQQEYIRRANEEAAKGNSAGAAGFRKQADELNGIIKEKSETAYFIQKTYENKLQTLKLDSLKKQFDEEQKAYERRLKNLETEHNNELKSVVDLESAKQVLRDEYSYSEEELNKLKDFEKAKSKIILEQQKETFEIQSEQLQSQIEQLQGVLSADDAMADTIWGRMFDEEQREQIIEWIERLQNELSKIGEPDESSTDIDAENKKLGSFIDIFGFTADQWEEAFNNLDTMSGKLALVQMGVQAMTNAWNQFYSIQRANMQRDLDAFTSATNRKKESLAKQLEEGYISQEVYNAKVAKLDAELEKKKAEMEYKSAMAEWKMSLLQAATNTAVGVTSALAMTPPNFVIAAIVGGMGAIQTALIAGNKPKKPEGYFDGGPTGGSGIYDEFGRELSDGPVHANEYVIPEWLRRDPQIARMEEFIEARRRGSIPVDSPITTAGGEARSTMTTAVNQQDSDDTNVVLALVMRELVETLREFPSKPIEAKLSRTMEVAKYISDDLESYNNHRIKNKR